MMRFVLPCLFVLACTSPSPDPDSGTLDAAFDSSSDSSAPDSSTGDSSTGDSSTGDSSTGDSSMGDSSTGDSSTGDSSVDAGSDDAGSLDGGIDAPDATGDARVCPDASHLPQIRCRTEGDTACNPDGGYFHCRDIDGDGCLELETIECGTDEHCELGACTCHDGCFPMDAIRCTDHEVSSVCGNHDADSCLEFGAPTTCMGGETCLRSAGVCSATCEHECAAGSHGCYGAGTRFSICGEYDSDACRDQSFIADCPSDRPICDTFVDTLDPCVECIGGIECAPALATCETGTCVPVPGTCFEAGPGSTLIDISGATAPEHVDVFFGLEGYEFDIDIQYRLRAPDGTTADLNDCPWSPPGAYVNSFYGVVDDTTAPDLTMFAGNDPNGTWELEIIRCSEFGAGLQRWAICLR